MMNPKDPSEIQNKSLILSRYFDQRVGSEEVFAFTTKAHILRECVHNASADNFSVLHAGSVFAGNSASVADNDILLIDNLVEVLLPEQLVSEEIKHKTVLYMKESDCPPGYRLLQLCQLGRKCSRWLNDSLVTVGDAVFVSNENCKKVSMETMGAVSKPLLSSGSLDIIFSLKCNSWPKEAYEFTTRTRLFAWPSQLMVDKIIHDGCELIPVGDQYSRDNSLQWKISFAAAERQIVYSLNHVQRKVFILLKHLLQEIERTLNDNGVCNDMLNSYVMKTALFVAGENSHQNFWQEQNLFFCFWFCYNIVLSWVKSGYCPNFFIPTKNIFNRPIHVQNQQKLFHILNDFHQRKWMSLSVVKFFGPSVLEQLSNERVQSVLTSPETTENIEWRRDVGVMECLKMDITANKTSRAGMQACKAADLLLRTESDSDEMIAYYKTCVTLSNMALIVYTDRTLATDNKARYKSLKKCKHLLLPRASIGTSLLYLATFHFHLGTYWKALDICRQVISNGYFDTSPMNTRQSRRYIDEFCNKGYTLYHKLKTGYTPALQLQELLSLPHLQPEISKCPVGMHIPPLPYAAFLSFLCCHELGDIKGRDGALREMIVVKYDAQQGGHRHWIVHTLLGICYQTIGDTRRAVRAYMDSHDSPAALQEFNPARERIDALRSSDIG
ncbi:uncharacterized protein LOC117331265 [Pecten maximus]|uniref:uncharacterized protein LOC117331265 n=1 Tax=Pecten maximus TaxID=6579 RepID=UPI00145842D8|nr:uncharacterized protein LOC117331265 [Pecten maximus]